ncbi:hypothetical protein AXF42_Ash019374 [Apostasia shenzhenica]|uniref:Uncharacterized protein n=1 Tax=Apostasia shenzhenica TaxID=1088818 RepID=A0A2H9ZTL3_9ASPA|nr:hypothetical protein AXF42_Ash019373 [Apostasia shenzhenica]PKA46633.1 hypothetical protein AXF42_Ash019374 [Apostasia shenzhenica]
MERIGTSFVVDPRNVQLGLRTNGFLYGKSRDSIFLLASFHNIVQFTAFNVHEKAIHAPCNDYF